MSKLELIYESMLNEGKLRLEDVFKCVIESATKFFNIRVKMEIAEKVKQGLIPEKIDNNDPFKRVYYEIGSIELHEPTILYLVEIGIASTYIICPNYKTHHPESAFFNKRDTQKIINTLLPLFNQIVNQLEKSLTSKHNINLNI